MDKTALLILDVQTGIVDRLTDTEAYLQRLVPAVATARAANLRIIHVVSAFRPGYPETHPRNTSSAKVREWGVFVEGDGTTEVHPAVAPSSSNRPSVDPSKKSADEVVVTKHRVSAFASTDLDLILRCAGIETLVVAGLITSGAVLSTVRQAADLDYRLVVLRDLCMDRDPDLHEVLMDKVLARQAQVVTSAEWMASLKQINPQGDI